MGKKLGLDTLYKSIGVFPTTSKFKERSLKLRAGNPSKLPSSALTVGKPLVNSKFMERSLKLRAGNVSGKSSSLFTDRALKLRAGQKLTTSVNKGSKLLNIGKKVFSKTPVGRAVNLAINVGSGIGIGYGIAKEKFSGKKADFQKGDYSDIKTDKKMGGGMMQGYGAARTSGMGLQDQSLMPGQMVRANKGKMAKVKKAALTATALLGANYVGKRSGEKAVIDSINSGQAFKPEGAKMSLFGASLKRSKGGKMVKMNIGGGMDAGAAQGKVDRIRAAYNLAKKNKGEDRLTQADIKMAEKILKKNR